MSSLNSREKLTDLERKGRGKGKDKRAKGHEVKRAKGQKPQTVIFPAFLRGLRTSNL